jgi:hypothetical protein
MESLRSSFVRRSLDIVVNALYGTSFVCKPNVTVPVD